MKYAISLSILFAFGIFWGCSTPPKLETKQIKKIELPNLYQKDRTEQALNADITSILDGILASSKDNVQLTEKESVLLEEYVHQNKLFEQEGFDRKWLDQIRANLKELEKREKNRIAPVLAQKLEDLYSEAKSGK
ncbi:hypothetical protein EHM76_01270 [bacterium]|nr:MAG: hypothetical protein EHM76_01270 [bacterium]